MNWCIQTIKNTKEGFYVTIFPFCQVVQLEELMAVRHSVFVVGNAGSGKSQVRYFYTSKVANV